MLINNNTIKKPSFTKTGTTICAMIYEVKKLIYLLIFREALCLLLIQEPLWEPLLEIKTVKKSIIFPKKLSQLETWSVSVALCVEEYPTDIPTVIHPPYFLRDSVC